MGVSKIIKAKCLTNLNLFYLSMFNSGLNSVLAYSALLFSKVLVIKSIGFRILDFFITSEFSTGVTVIL